MGLEILAETLDTKKTIENVKNFFKHDFPRLLDMSDFTRVDLKSPSFSSEPHGSMIDNSNESKIVSYMEADRAVRAVVRALDGMSNEKYASIIKRHYILGLDWETIADDYGYTTRNIMRVQNKAYISFADSLAKYYELREFL